MGAAIYRMSKSFGVRPYTYVASNLQSEKNRFNLDLLIEGYGLEAEAEIEKEIAAKIAKSK